MSRTHLIIGLVAATLLLVGAAAWRADRAAPRFHGTTYDQVARAADFALVDHHGRPTSLDSLAGAPALLFFGYTRGPDVCPLTLSRLARATRGTNVQVVLVTVDPGHDTPAVLERYVRRFGRNVTGLTGDSASIAGAMAAYGAYTMPATHAGHGPAAPALGHSAVVYGVDSRGNLRVVISESAREAELHDDVRTLARL